MTPKFKQNYDHYIQKYNSLVIEAKSTAYELDILAGTFALRRHHGINILPYFKVGDKDNSKVVVLLIDLAYYRASDTHGVLSELDRKKYIKEYLNSKYQRVSLGKKDFSSELRVHLNTLGMYMKKNYICRWDKDGRSKNSKVIFNIHDIADFFSVPVQTI